MSDRVFVKLANRDEPLVFGGTAVKVRDDGLLEITLWEPVNDALERSVEIKPEGWEWYEVHHEDDGKPAEPRVLNPKLDPAVVRASSEAYGTIIVKPTEGPS